MENKTNSIIFENPYKDNIQDFSKIGVLSIINTEVEVNQKMHRFQVGDVLFFDFKEHKYNKALAINHNCSEVIGVVSSLIDDDNFRFTNKGLIKTNRYQFNNGDILYLSDSAEGKLINIEPTVIIKQIAIQSDNGIIIDIQRGYKVKETEDYTDECESYTQEELDNIIKNIW